MRVLLVVTALASGSAAFGICADESGFLDFEAPEVDRHEPAPDPYFGTTWRREDGTGHPLLLIHVPWYNDAYSEFGADLTPRSGDQVGASSLGLDNINVFFEGDVFIDFYVTPQAYPGPEVMQVDFYNDDVLVHAITNIPMVLNEWSHVDGSGVAADRIVIRNFGDERWWLIDDLTFTKVPAPAALAVAALGLATIGGRRRRR